MKGLKINATSSNRVETETATEKNISTEGSIAGTLVGYMKSDLKYIYATGNTSYVWGAVQNASGRDKVAGQGNDKVVLTVKMNTVEPKSNPVQPVNPEQPVQPVTPVSPETSVVPVSPETPVTPTTPVNPSNGGRGNGGGGRSGVAPATPSRTTTPGTVLGENRPTASTPTAPVGEVLGENRVAPVAEASEEKKGVVLGESRPSVKGVSDRASVATGDYNFTGLWASLFGISLASLAGFVVVQKRKETNQLAILFPVFCVFYCQGECLEFHNCNTKPLQNMGKIVLQRFFEVGIYGKTSEVKDYENNKLKRHAVQAGKRGNLSPSVLTESEQGEA